MKAKADPYDFLVRPEHMPRGSLASHVVEQFRNAIVSLKLAPGTMLDRTEICDRLGVSRTPVAEAMARLKSEGLIEILPQRGTIVSLVSIDAVEEYIFMRKALEGETVRVLAQNRPEGLIEALEDNLERQRASFSADDSAFHELDLEFHNLMLTAAGYRRIKAMVDTARNNLSRARQLVSSRRRIGVGIDQHADILEAITGGHGEHAAHLMRDHLDGVLREVHLIARQSPELFTDGIIAFPAIAPAEANAPWPQNA